MGKPAEQGKHRQGEARGKQELHWRPHKWDAVVQGASGHTGCWVANAGDSCAKAVQLACYYRLDASRPRFECKLPATCACVQLYRGEGAGGKLNTPAYTAASRPCRALRCRRRQMQRCQPTRSARVAFPRSSRRFQTSFPTAEKAPCCRAPLTSRRLLCASRQGKGWAAFRFSGSIRLR